MSIKLETLKREITTSFSILDQTFVMHTFVCCCNKVCYCSLELLLDYKNFNIIFLQYSSVPHVRKNFFDFRSDAFLLK